MSEPFIGEIRIFGGGFAPRGWALCNGQLLPINANTALFSILGTTYGGNGRTTFALPDLRGRAPLQAGQAPGLSNYALGETVGDVSVTLTSNEMPDHTHVPAGSSSAGTDVKPGNGLWAIPGAGRGVDAYTNGTGDVKMSPSVLSVIGGGQPHNNMPPYLVVNYIIALEGIFPSRP